MAVKFPGNAVDTEQFWNMLLEKRSALSKVPKERYNVDAFDVPSEGHFIQDKLGAFDAAFFTVPPAEAENMDPQQRWLLETSYQALENSGITLDQAAGSQTSVHVGCFTQDFEKMMQADVDLPGRHKVLGSSKSILANRVSWFYDLHGPSVVVDTACSSSLVALHQACQALRNGDATMGIVAGVNIFFDPAGTMNMNNLGFLSPDSKCYSFDHRANGYSRGEGVGAVVIKPLTKAVQDRNCIRAVIRATGSNQDGRTPGITQPSGLAQEQLIRSTYKRAGLNMAITRYFEAHGTGTAVGDPIEAKAIADAFKDSVREPLFVGAVKSNIGHLEGASGIAGLIKTVLVLERGVIPANIWFERVNPKIDAEAWKLIFPTETVAWPSLGLRRASVNSFGFGGTNAHAVLDDAYHFLLSRGFTGGDSTKYTSSNEQLGTSGVKLEEPRSGQVSQLLTLSAFDEAGIERLTSTLLRSHMAEHKSKALEDVAYTLNEKRNKLAWRSFTVVTSEQSFSELIWSEPVRATEKSNICFVFTGQGAQWRHMGHELLRFEVFERAINDAERFLSSLGCYWSIREAIFVDFLPEDGYADIHEAQFSQPLCTVIQVALVDLLASWDIKPAVVVGHSSGEIAAAYCSGSMSRETAWKVSYYRGLAISQTLTNRRSSSSMMAIQLPADRLAPYLSPWNYSCSESDRITIACYNSPCNVTVSGPIEGLDFLGSSLERHRVLFRRLNVDVGYHSSFMNEAAKNYRQYLGSLWQGEAHEGRSRFISTVTGSQIAPRELQSSEYWVSNLLNPVQFSDVMSTVLCSQRDPKRVDDVEIAHVLEIGPHSTLRSPLRDILKTLDKDISTCYSSVLVRDRNAFATAFECVGRLYCSGHRVDLATINGELGRTKTPQMLPSTPPYPFNRIQNYWVESRLDQSFRCRKFGRHELLGTPAHDWNELEARWNNRLIMKEMDFLSEHRVNGMYVYPAAGMIIMAIEAVRQLLPVRSPVTGYRFKNISFQSALTLNHTSEGTETQLILRPSPAAAANPLSKWNEFRICIFENKAWRECCRGLVIVEYEDSAWSPSGIKERENDDARRTSFLDRALSRCRISLDKRKVYQALEKIGLGYGPPFQGLANIRVDNNGYAVGVVNLQHRKLYDTGDKCKAHLIHPTALDGILQLAFPALTGSVLDSIPTMVPTCIADLWISSEINESSTQHLDVCATSRSTGLREIQASLMAKDVSNDKLMLTAEASMTIVDSVRPIEPANRDPSRRFWKVVCQPDVELLDDAKQLGVRRDFRSIPDIVVPDIDVKKDWLCLIAISAVIAGLPPSYTAPTPHLQRYVDWMERQLVLAKGSSRRFEPARECSDLDPDHFHHSVRDFDGEGVLLANIAESLSEIVRGRIDPLEFLFSNDLLERIYREGIEMKDHIKAYFKAAAHKTPGLRILEVGAGTGAMTSLILAALRTHTKHDSAIELFAEYFYTDISPGFFAQASERFAESRLNFKTLDISSDPGSQGFETGVFDIVTASDVLHATPKIEETLRNCRNLLKPGGKLVFHEHINPASIKTGFVFGLLPGWWLSQEEHRQWSPLMSQTEWNGHLIRAGFSGVDLVLEDVYGAPNHSPTSAVLVSTAIDATPLTQPTIKAAPIVQIIYEKTSGVQNQIRKYLQQQHAALGLDAILTVVDAEAATVVDFTDSTCIFLCSFDRPLLQNLDDKDLALIKKIWSQAYGMIWVSGQPTDPDLSPSHALAKGLARTLESENLDFGCVNITLEAPYDIGRIGGHIWKVLLKNPPRSQTGYESEYVVQNDVLCLPRVVEAPEVTARIYPDPDVRQLVARKWNDGFQTPIKLTIGAVGLLDTLTFEEFERNTTPLELHEAEVRVLAVGLNFKDVLTALGQVSDNYLGNELVGVVTSVRSSATTNFEIGDTVIGVHTGTMATTVRCKACQLHKLPANIPLSTGAALPLVYCTVYYSLVTWARARSGESILIHSGAGGVGQAAIQLAKTLGLTIFTTTSSDEKVRLLIDLYDIPQRHIFSSRSIDFASRIQRLTGDVGVDIVLNSLSGDALRRSWEVLAPFGRFIELGKKDIHSTETSCVGGLPMQPFAKNVMFASVDMPSLYKTQDRITEVLSAVVKLVVEGKIRPPSPVQVFKGSEIQQAFRLMQTGKHMGKLVVEFADEDIVEVVKLKPTRLFDSRATYIISGGLGGIARSICIWMVEKGARYIVLLSRSRVYASETEGFLDEMRSRGAKVTAQPCDVGGKGQLRHVLASIEDAMPPIKGCFQAAMVLRNVSFNNMTIEDWTAAIRPKVDGSWNLHTMLPKSMDFFILLSSHSGLLGTHGQSNYAAGNVFQDELARHRVSRGERAMSINLGSMSSIGYVANNNGGISQALKQGTRDFSEEELFSLLAYYCDPALQTSSLSEAQIVTPIGIPAILKAEGSAELSWMEKPIVKHLHHVRILGQPTLLEANPTRSWEVQLREAQTIGGAESIVREAIRKQLADLLAIGIDDVDVSKPVHSYGVDSLVAIELRNWFIRSLGADVAVFEILGNSAITALAWEVTRKCRFVNVSQE
ncbi:hypothetical protein BDV95DRAFT_652025 [Massariosphaeria phaeospora]|uniref:Uncharacterized protein n=1 Tax=Massariosphaeria phaeospora TaxID=100035 RepID=A0A7C8HYX6_9PLEO|nr:hypothetical protein BDV95DRAFT_652025 [Massariosphaeria phaeospora]